MRSRVLVFLFLAVAVTAGIVLVSPRPVPSPEGAAAGTPIATPQGEVLGFRQEGPAGTETTGPGLRVGVAEAFRNDRSSELGISWERDVFSWAAIQPNGPEDWKADRYFEPALLQRERDRGIEVVGVIQFTPSWAAANPTDGERSVPKNLAAPPDSANNYWARFASRLAAYYRGRIDRWVIWNEPEFKPSDQGAGESYSWLGSDYDYYLLLKRGYQAIKAANPAATVVFAGTSYWVDISMGRRPFFQRVLDIAAADPEARPNGFFFDAMALNLYRCPDDLYRIHSEMKAAMKSKGIDKPIWLTETNAMPYDDPLTPKAKDGQRVTLEQQADYAVQAMAMAAAAGYEWFSWYRIDDGGIWRSQEAWGLVRDNGSGRPVFQAVKAALPLLSGPSKITFSPLERDGKPFGTPWPQDPKSYYPNWQVYQVVFDHPDGQRVTVLWNGDGKAVKVLLPSRGSGAMVVDRSGIEKPLTGSGGWYLLELSPATAQGPTDPQGYHFIGGPPLMVVEKGVAAGVPTIGLRTED